MTEEEQRAIGRMEGKIDALAEQLSHGLRAAEMHRVGIDKRLNPLHDQLLGGPKPLLPRLSNVADAYERAGWLGKVLVWMAPLFGGVAAGWAAFSDKVIAFINSNGG